MKKTTDLSGTSKGYKVFSVAILVVMVIFLSISQQHSKRSVRNKGAVLYFPSFFYCFIVPNPHGKVHKPFSGILSPY